MKLAPKTLGAAAAVLLGVCSMGASAAIVYTGWQSATTGRKAVDGTATTLAFARYDAAGHNGAALQSIAFQLAGTGSAVYTFTNRSGGALTLDFRVDMTIAVADPITGIEIKVVPAIADITRTVASGATYSSPGSGHTPDYDAVGVLKVSVSNNETYLGQLLTPEIAARFSGTGTVELSASATVANRSSYTGGGVLVAASAYAATLQVSYGYESPIPITGVPEPASIALLGLGMAGMGALARCRRV